MFKTEREVPLITFKAQGGFLSAALSFHVKAFYNFPTITLRIKQGFLSAKIGIL